MIKKPPQQRSVLVCGSVKYSDLFVLELDLIAMWPTSRKAVADSSGLETGPFAGR